MGGARRTDALLPTRKQARRFGAEVLRVTLDHVYGGERRTFSGATLEQLDRLFDGPLPEKGGSPDRVLRECRDKVFRHSMQMSHPRIFGLFNPAPLPVAAFAEIPVAFLNQSVDAWKAGPAATHLEMRLIRWFNDLIGFDRRAFGVFTSGGGVANAIALKMARDRAAGARTRRDGVPSRLARRLRVYASEQAHFSIRRSLDLLGLGEASLVLIEADDSMKMRVDRLEETLRRDRRRGLVPMAVVATAGTTNTGNIDPLRDLGHVARAHDTSYHVDAAYGGALLFSRLYADRLDGLALADSVTVDPHKWLFQPFSLGGLFVRSRQALSGSFRIEPGYLKKELEAEPERLDFYHYSLEGTRPFRGLKLWFTLKSLGRQGLGRLVDRTMEVAHYLGDEVERHDCFERLKAPIECASVCFRYMPGWSRRMTRRTRASSGVRSRLNKVQNSIQQEVERRGFAWFPNIVIGQTVFFRFGIFNYMTSPADVDSVLAHIRKTASRLGF